MTFRDRWRAQPWGFRAAVIVGLFVVGVLGARTAERDTDTLGSHYDREPFESGGEAVKLLHVSSAVSEAPEALRIRVLTPNDFQDIDVDPKAEVETNLRLQCPGGTFRLSLQAWTPEGDLRRDDHVDYRCTDGPQTVYLWDHGTHYRLTIGPDAFAQRS